MPMDNSKEISSRERVQRLFNKVCSHEVLSCGGLFYGLAHNSFLFIVHLLDFLENSMLHVLL